MRGFILALSLCVLLLPAAAQAVTIEPVEALTDDVPSNALILHNDKTVAQTYSIAWKNPRDERLIRFAPRRLTLDPGQSAFIHLLLRPGTDIKPGEYSSELVITPEKNPERYAMGAAEAAPSSLPDDMQPASVTISSKTGFFGPPAP